MSYVQEISPGRCARIAGLGYLVIIAAGIFAEFFVRGQLMVRDDATATAGNIVASEQLFRFSIASDLVMLLCDAMVAVLLYVLFRSVNRPLALMATGFRLVHTAVYGANLLNLVLVLLSLGGVGALTTPEADLARAQAMVFLGAHSYGYALGLVFFAVHCLILAFLLFKSPHFPRILGVLIGIASVGYFVDSFAKILLSDYAAYESILIAVVFVPAFVAELSLALWLAIKGVRYPLTTAPA